MFLDYKKTTQRKIVNKTFGYIPLFIYGLSP